MAKILLATSSFDVDNNPALTRLRDAGYELVSNPFGRRLDKEEIQSLLAPDVVAAVGGLEPYDNEVLAASGLKMLCRCGSGMDNVDMAAAREHGIEVRNTPEAPATAVAELTMALMMAVVRRVPEADRAVRGGDWPRLKGGLLGARTVVIVGYGRVGRRVATICSAFGARVLVVDPEAAEAAAAAGYETATLNSALGQADILTLHLPLTQSTRYMIGEAEMARMPAGGILLNVARGGLVDETALERALRSDHLGGAGLDCFENEPYSGPLSGFDNVVLTPHLGSLAHEARSRMEFEAAEHVAGYLLGTSQARGSVEDGG